MRYTPGIISSRRSGYFFLSGFLLAQTLTSWANPTGGQVVSGTASINTVPGTVTINQATTTAIINWQNFSIAAGELTRFQVPTSASATLNRVTGGNVSSIYGTLESNGQLYLINPNGILIGSSGVINTAGFVASTLDFSDAQFNAQGNLNFSGSSNASVNNQGTINASLGNVYLIATQVDNGGTITAPQGNVGLAAGSQVLLQSVGDQHLFVQVDSTATPQATGVTNTGTIRSAAAELKAAGGNAYALAINNSGNIAATGIATINGQVYLTADGADITNSGAISAQQANGNGGTVVLNAHRATATTKGTLLNSGTITATGTAPGTTGGTVELLGDRVGVTGSGAVDVSGDAGGGTALIGGDEHGANPAIPDASQTYLGPDATIAADALTLGMGGKVIVWGNETTQVYGQISARGGPQGGNGGFVETSAAELQVLTAADVSAPKGQGGTWLLDPSTVLITDSEEAIGSGYNGAPYDPDSPAFTITSSTVTITQATLQSALEDDGGPANVVIDASQGPEGGGGTINWTSTTPLSTNNINGSTLELDAPVSLTLSGVTISGTGSLNLSLNGNPAPGDAVGSVSITGSNINLNGGNFTAVGIATAAGSPGVGITANSVITTTANGYISIQGTGLLAPGNDATGVMIDDSSVTLTGASTGYMEIQGDSDAGFSDLTQNFTNSSYGVQILSSTISSSSANGLNIHGTAYAANNVDSIGVDLGTDSESGTLIETSNGEAEIKASVLPESFYEEEDVIEGGGGDPPGEANVVAGVETTDTTIEANGATATISIDTDTHHATATDNGDPSVDVRNVGAYFLDDTSITASGSNVVLSTPIFISGRSGSAQASSGNTFETDSIGVWLSGGTAGATITNSGLGATILVGAALPEKGEELSATGPDVASVGVAIGNSGAPPDSITSPGGGSIGIAGLGGTVSAGSGLADGVAIEYSNVSTTTGDIAILAAAGSTSGGSSIDIAGLALESATLQTNTSLAGSNQIPNGGSAPPAIVIYATDSTAVRNISTGDVAFQLGSPSDYAVQEDDNSSLVTGNLVMGNYYSQLTTYAPSHLIDAAENFIATFNSSITTGNDASIISSEGITLNPAGIIDLTSPRNQITNLDAALVGSGGLYLDDNVDLTIGPIGDTDGQNYGQIDESPIAPVLITAPNLVYVYPNSGSGTIPIGSPIIPIVLAPVNNSLADIAQIFQPSNPTGTGGGKGDKKIIGGAGGVAGGQDQNTGRGLEIALARKYGLALGAELFQIIKQDLLDGSTVNTATLGEKWVANTGLSKLVGVNGNAELFDGLAEPVGNAPPIFGEVQAGAGDLGALDRAAFGHGSP